MKEIVIGLAAGRKYENYLRWVSSEENVRVVKLGHPEGNFDAVKACDGLIFCGGEDVHPQFYQKPEYLSAYHLDDIDEARDEFELKLLSYSQQHELPVLGICRGLQIANVYFGGTLIPDIPSIGKSSHSKFEEGKDRHHPILVSEGSFLKSVTGSSTGAVNSSHHQSVDVAGKGLSVSARSEDDIVEAMERDAPGTHPYLLLVQWHPERMSDQHSVFSMNLKQSFLSQVAATT